jgi:hypothetical protein
MPIKLNPELKKELIETIETAVGEGGWQLIADAINNIGILQGEKGDAGETGAKGDPAGVAIEAYNWSGSQVVADGSFLNLGSLPLVLDTTISNIGIDRTGNVFKFPEKTQRTQVVFRIRLNGTIGGSSGTSREFYVQTRRPDATTLVGSKSSVKVTGTSISNRDIELLSYTGGATDRFTTEGVIVGPSNSSGQIITLTAVNLAIIQIG